LMEEHIQLKKELGELGPAPGFPTTSAARSSITSHGGPNAPRSPSGGSSAGWGSPPASSTTGAPATAWPTSTTRRSPATGGSRTGRREPSSTSTPGIRWKATAGSPS
jgi:hypothetical protein